MTEDEKPPKVKRQQDPIRVSAGEVSNARKELARAEASFARLQKELTKAAERLSRAEEKLTLAANRHGEVLAAYGGKAK